jgi:hypothetical protein
MAPHFARAEGLLSSILSVMSTLALEIDQTLQQLDSATASRLERLVREALALVKSSAPAEAGHPPAPATSTGKKVNGLEVIPSGGRVVTSELVQRLMEESEAA